MLQTCSFNLHPTVFYIISLTLLIFVPKDIHTWDVAVANDQGLTLLTLDGIVEHNIVNNVEDDPEGGMYALAFDPFDTRFFYTNSDSNFSIWEYDLTHNVTQPVIPRGNVTIQGLAYDSSSHNLFWTDGNGQSIHRMLMNSRQRQQETLLVLPSQVPMGIAVSSCHRAIFWANNNHTSASLNRAELDGTKHTVIATQDVFQPLGVAIDEVYGKIYWTDDWHGIYYRIERSGLDGTNRELVLQRTHQDPFGLALLSSTIVWSDTVNNQLWSLSTDMTFPNHTMAKLEPILLFRYSHQKPAGIVANRNVTVSCEPIKVLRTVVEDVIDDKPTDDVPQFCLNGGELLSSSCRCKKEYIGTRCEIPLCYQHCLHGGKCIIDRLGYPDCQCQPGYEGRRCERDVCDDYCLAGGRCFIESGQPICKCQEGTTGQRCEVAMSLATAPNPQVVPIIAAFSAVGCALLILVIVLSWRVIVLRRRPRVKKRYIVNKSYRAQSGQTAMTARPPTGPAMEQCEITIENCCNMNICETPCFDPNIRTPKSSNKKSEDKRNLLLNMEEPVGSD